ncbi:hypothetical protein [Priestia koreensis]|uniref:hypothetical protein n=1 Tax=Priestia koreensis TaxID=284581 RepID=UPI00345AF63A
MSNNNVYVLMSTDQPHENQKVVYNKTCILHENNMVSEMVHIGQTMTTYEGEMSHFQIHTFAADGREYKLDSPEMDISDRMRRDLVQKRIAMEEVVLNKTSEQSILNWYENDQLIDLIFKIKFPANQLTDSNYL